MFFLCTDGAERNRNELGSLLGEERDAVAMIIEGSGFPCLVPVPALPSLQQRELSPTLGAQLRLAYLRPGQEHSSGDWLESVLTDLDRGRAALNADRVGLIGTSALGLIAAEYALRHAERAAFLVLVGSPPRIRDLGAAQEEEFARTADVARRQRLRENLRHLESSLAAAEEQAQQALLESQAYAPMAWFDANFDPTDLLSGLDLDHQSFRKGMGPALEGIDLSERLAHLRCPLLRIQGRFDFIAPEAMWKGVEEGSHGAEHVEFEHSGHHPPLEESQRFEAVVKSWLGRIGIC